MKHTATYVAVLAAGALWVLGCGHGDGLMRGLYDGAQIRHRSQQDPPHDPAPTYDQYQEIRKGTQDRSGDTAQ